MISKTQMLMLSSASPRKIKELKQRWQDGGWVPHPRTGIFVPKGREWVVDDVPEKAASLNQTYWLRNVDGVERPDPDNPDHTPPHHPCLPTN
ncbi:2-oxoglutarate (2OG) and Fe(II)-dependent oxygenase superfamily [Salix suchowensis]|nr:2-oxoglutarate (2OG) and Fe(II)-dependent oxygenase superfamily [Salix suchowensis]